MSLQRFRTTPLYEVIRTWVILRWYSVLLLYRCRSCCHKGFAKSFEQNRNIEFAKFETCCMMGEWIIYAIHKNISALAPVKPSEASNLTVDISTTKRFKVSKFCMISYWIDIWQTIFSKCILKINIIVLTFRGFHPGILWLGGQNETRISISRASFPKGD